VYKVLNRHINTKMEGFTMAGYHGYSKSNNALDAESEGRHTASKLARRLGVDTQAVTDHCSSREFHHTSKWYNATYYYDEPALLIEADSGLDADDLDDDEREEAAAKLTAMRADTAARRRSKRKPPEVWEGCTVTWLEWSGSRAHPKCNERTEKECKVVRKPSTFTYIITMADGRELRKRDGTRGLAVLNANGNKINW
jgi:hypothetical protein